MSPALVASLPVACVWININCRPQHLVAGFCQNHLFATVSFSDNGILGYTGDTRSSLLLSMARCSVLMSPAMPLASQHALSDGRGRFGTIHKCRIVNFFAAPYVRALVAAGYLGNFLWAEAKFLAS